MGFGDWLHPTNSGPALSLLIALAPHAFYPTLCWQTAGQGHLTRATPTIVRVWVTRGCPSHCAHVHAHALVGLLPHAVWVRAAINWAIMSLALTLSQVSLLLLSTFWVATIIANMRCQGTVQVPDRVVDMFSDLMEEAILEVLFDL